MVKKIFMIDFVLKTSPSTYKITVLNRENQYKFFCKSINFGDVINVLFSRTG